MIGDSQGALLAEAIKIILDGSPKPRWLEPRLRRMVSTISTWRQNEAQAPILADMKIRMRDFQTAAETLKIGVSDPSFESFLGAGWLPPGIGYVEVLALLETLIDRAEKASLQLVGKGKGPFAFPKPPNEAISAMELCAWTVKQAMMQCRPRRKFPDGREIEAAIGPDNSGAHIAANRLWKLAGGAPLGSRDEVTTPPSGWRNYFISVKAAEDAGGPCAAGLDMMRATFQALLVEFDKNEMNGVNS